MIHCKAMCWSRIHIYASRNLAHDPTVRPSQQTGHDQDLVVPPTEKWAFHEWKKKHSVTWWERNEGGTEGRPCTKRPSFEKRGPTRHTLTHTHTTTTNVGVNKHVRSSLQERYRGEAGSPILIKNLANQRAPSQKEQHRPEPSFFNNEKEQHEQQAIRQVRLGSLPS